MSGLPVVNWNQLCRELARAGVKLTPYGQALANNNPADAGTPAGPREDATEQRPVTPRQSTSGARERAT